MSQARAAKTSSVGAGQAGAGSSGDHYTAPSPSCLRRDCRVGNPLFLQHMIKLIVLCRVDILLCVAYNLTTHACPYVHWLVFKIFDKNAKYSRLNLYDFVFSKNI